MRRETRWSASAVAWLCMITVASMSLSVVAGSEKGVNKLRGGCRCFSCLTLRHTTFTTLQELDMTKQACTAIAVKIRDG